MGTSLDRIGRTPEFDAALDSSSLEIQFRDPRAIPQAHPRFGVGPVGDDGIGINGRNISIGAQIEGLQNSAGANVEENDIVGQIVRDKQTVAFLRTQNDKSSRIGRRGAWRRVATIENDRLAW